jgi:CspA family cold shock protein
MPTGTIVFFHSRKGYGFIKTDDDSESDIFVHMDDVEGPDLVEAERVEFEVEDAPKGPRATNVTRLSESDAE